MKQLKLFTLMLFSIVLFAGVSACSSSPEDTLKKEIEAANKKFPQSMGNGLELTGFSIEGNKVVCLITIDESKGIPLKALESQKSEMKKSAASSLASSKEVDKLFELMIELNDSLVYRMKSSTSGQSFDIEYTPEELKQLMKK